MMIPYILLQTIVAPVVAALIILLTRRIIGKKARFIPCITLLYTTALICIAGISVYQGTPIREEYVWGPYVTFGLLADGLSIPVALIINLWGVVGGTFVLFGSVLVYSQIGTFAISELHTLAGNPMTFWIALLILLGVSTKLAIFPLHVWMPWVHAEHPTCIAGLLAVYANIGAYVIVRVLILPLHNDLKVFSIPLMILALITILYGALLSLAQTDVKRLCACSTIGQISYSVLGLGALTIWSIEGGMFYFLSHILGKAIFFSTAGILVYITGIRDMNKMGGLVHKMPITALLWITASAILTGIPLTSGFTGKWILFTGIFRTNPTSIGLIIASLGILSTILTGVYTFWAAKRIFFGPLKPELANNPKVMDPPLTMWVPLLILAVISFIIGLYPEPFMVLFHTVVGLL